MRYERPHEESPERNKIDALFEEYKALVEQVKSNPDDTVLQESIRMKQEELRAIGDALILHPVLTQEEEYAITHGKYTLNEDEKLLHQQIYWMSRQLDKKLKTGGHGYDDHEDYGDIDDFDPDHDYFEDLIKDKKNHPELMDDEVYLANVPPEHIDNYYAEWKTKRFGKIAYDAYGQEVKNYIPVFVKEFEFRMGRKSSS